MSLLALLIELFFADSADVVFVAVLFDNFATRFVVIGFVERMILWRLVSWFRALDDHRFDRRSKQFVIVDVGRRDDE